MKTGQRPYLIRAMHDWMADKGLTPHLVVSAPAEGLVVPERHISDGKIVLNVSQSAARDLVLGNEEITLEARFDGEPWRLSIPVDTVLGIYARETGQGMIFPDENAPPGDGSPQPSPGSGRPNLKIVK